MEISDELHCLFSANLEERDESYVVEVPQQDVHLGDLQEGETYRVAVLTAPVTNEADGTDADGTDADDTEADPNTEQARQTPPVEEGEQRTVEIEDLGEQGDGLIRVERGYVVIIPDTKQGERVTIEITDVNENFAFAEVVERVSYYD
jgi:predicted RNA-binding protein with TRAM domain